MSEKKTQGIDIFSSRSELSNLMEAATGEPTEAPVAPVNQRERPATSPNSLEVLDGGSNKDEIKPKAQPKTRPPKSEPTIKTTSTPEPAVEDNVPFRVRIPSGLKGEWSTFKAELSAALGGVSLDDSNIGRPLLEVILVDYKEQILAQAEELKGTLKRPSNSDRVAMAELDDELGQVLRKALRQRRKKG